MKVSVGTADIREGERRSILEVIDSGWITLGPKVGEFEKRFARYCGTKEGVAVSSGTDADMIAAASLVARGVAKRGDEVILPALTFIATANAVYHAGLRPVFVDVDPADYCIDPGQIEEKITKRTKAIMPVHLFGHPANMDPVLELGEKHGLAVIEDAAEAHGSTYRGRKVGGIGTMGAFSFYVAHIITCGEGGMVVTNDEAYAEILRSLRAHGRACTCKTCVLLTSGRLCKLRLSDKGALDRRFRFAYRGFSCKMNEMEAAIGLAQLERLEDIIDARRGNMQYLSSELERFGDSLQLPSEKPYARYSPLAYPIIIREGAGFKREKIVSFLEQRGIETRPAFGCVPTQQEAYADLGIGLGSFPNSEHIGANGFYIGCHQNISRKELDYIVEQFMAFFSGLR